MEYYSLEPCALEPCWDTMAGKDYAVDKTRINYETYSHIESMDPDQIIYKIIDLADEMRVDNGMDCEDFALNFALIAHSPHNTDFDCPEKSTSIDHQWTLTDSDVMEPIQEWIDRDAQYRASPLSQEMTLLTDPTSPPPPEMVSPISPQDFMARADSDAVDSAVDSEDSDSSDPDWRLGQDKRSRRPKRLASNRPTSRPKRARAASRRRSSDDSSGYSSCGSSCLSPASMPASPLPEGDCRAPRAKITVWLAKLLQNPEFNPSVMCWQDEAKGIFRIVEPKKLAKLWGEAKGNPTMNYEKLSRAMRYYYDRKELTIVRKKMINQFGPRACWTRDQLIRAKLI